MLNLLLITVALLALAFIGLGFNIFIRKIAFPDTEIGHNREMKELGINCAKCDEWKSFKEKRKYKKLKLDITKIEL